MSGSAQKRLEFGGVLRISVSLVEAMGRIMMRSGVLFAYSVVGLLGLWGMQGAHAQTRTGGSWAWKPLFEHQGIEFEYLFYSRANNVHNGVVIKLTNTNDHAVDYRFKVVFRAGDAEHVELATGSLEAGESKTGDKEGLFWIPFDEGQSIEEVGLRGYRITRRAEPDRGIHDGLHVPTP